MIKPLIMQALHNLHHQKLSQDIAFTLGSFVVLAISGIVINITITALRDAAALGVFNLSYAVYIVASQFAVFGLHYSVLRHAAYHEDSDTERGRLLYTACACSILMGIAAAGVLYLAEPLFALLFKSETTGRAIRNAALGLTLFPLNKVLIAYLNGLRHMKAFSILQALRYLAVMVLVVLVAASSLPIEAAPFCFLFAEVVTAALAIAYLIKRRLTGIPAFSPAWVKQHFKFGAKGLMAGIFAEMNARIDVMMIGFFLNDHAVGIYSFAAMLVDGLYHVLAMVRINFNPMLVSALRDRQLEQAMRLRSQSKRFVLPMTLLLTLVIVVAYYVFSVWVMPDKGLLEGLPSLLILLTGLVLVSFLVPFDNLMMVSGHPGYQTVQQLTAVASNVLFAVLLLPVLGIEGAAFGTAISYVAGITMLAIFARHVIGWQLLKNSFQ